MVDTQTPGLRILHVDDDDDTREIVAVTMEIFGEVELLQFASGKAALERAEAFKPDVILLDYLMPEMSGLEILQRVKEMPGLSGAAIVFMTGRSDDEEIRDMRDAGAASVIVKPFEPAELLPMLEAAVASASGSMSQPEHSQ